ncbi:hypothetical protein ASF53_05085 [Methylobacterium sp. Leaf123]|uniref:hypothetical protein n=1 Tax=Methylobacterium sp. Leaf123 TaxID=1736264 RepID=UPI0006FA7BBA|nr:hypothetical protein [Methylobacterium sp. Leaf123]KQQ23702.1 hypothetical protein ASF53_05085 [Methylobacterium sp. Leaf123]
MIPPDVSDKLTKLIPLLGSDNDGEALGAARAIGRTLQAAGLDFHALADRVRPGAAEVPRIVYRDVPYATPHYNYADSFRQARPPVSPHEPADALTRSFGLPIYCEERLSPWWDVGSHCLTLNRTIPKKYGGRFLREFEVAIIRDIVRGVRTPTNAQASWLETVVARCHQARDAQRRAETSHAP